MPVNKRSTSSQVKSGAKADATPKQASITTAIMSTGRRPIRSARRPNTKAPTSMPTKNSVPVCKACGRVSANVVAIDGALKPIDSTCMASASQTRPKIRKMRYWNLPTPAACRACSTEAVGSSPWGPCGIPFCLGVLRVAMSSRECAWTAHAPVDHLPGLMRTHQYRILE